jgi:hypothetical protein
MSHVKKGVIEMIIEPTDGICIIDESNSHIEYHQLYINKCRRAAVSTKYGRVQLHWEVAGAQYWPEAKLLLQGLLQLSVIADRLSVEIEARE